MRHLDPIRRGEMKVHAIHDNRKVQEDLEEWSNLLNLLTFVDPNGKDDTSIDMTCLQQLKLDGAIC